MRVAARRAGGAAIGTEEGELWPFGRRPNFRPPRDLRGRCGPFFDYDTEEGGFSTPRARARHRSGP